MVVLDTAHDGGAGLLGGAVTGDCVVDEGHGHWQVGHVGDGPQRRPGSPLLPAHYLHIGAVPWGWNFQRGKHC